MNRAACLFAVLMTLGCTNVLAVREVPEIIVGEPSFFRTIEAILTRRLLAEIKSK